MLSANCPVCKSNKSSLFLDRIFDSLITKVLECSNCGMQFLHPMMNDKEEDRYYSNYYKKQQKRYFKQSSLQEIQQNSFKHYKQYYDLYHKIIKGRQKILEIGSGAGGFIKFIKTHCPAAEIVAIEKSKPNLDFLKKSFKDVRLLSDIHELKLTNKFDLIAGFGILDHLRNGLAFLTYLRPFLNNSNSPAVFNVCNKRNPLMAIYDLEEFKRFNYMKQHPCTYSIKALRILAKKAGYRIERINYLQVWGLDNHISWLKNREPREFSKYTDILSTNTLKAYNNDLIKLQTTDLMMISMRKSRKLEV